MSVGPAQVETAVAVPRWRVTDVMGREPVTVVPSTTIATAIDLTLAAGQVHVVVVDDRGVLLDLVPAQLLSTALLTRIVTRHQPVGDALVADPLRIGVDAELAEAVELMLAAGADAIGVVDGRGRVVGVLTWTDVGRAAARPPGPPRTDHL